MTEDRHRRRRRVSRPKLWATFPGWFPRDSSSSASAGAVSSGGLSCRRDAGVWRRSHRDVREDLDRRWCVFRGLDAEVQSARAEWPKVTSVLRCGRPWRTIVDGATKKHADLVVMGTHGRRGLPHAPRERLRLQYATYDLRIERRRLSTMTWFMPSRWFFKNARYVGDGGFRRLATVA
jgi:hypothetical protein